MSAREPGLGEHRRRAFSPQVEQAGEIGGEQRSESLRKHLRGKGRALPVGKDGRSGKVDSETDGNAVRAPLEQDPG
jgi:hypothetical protein